MRRISVEYLNDARLQGPPFPYLPGITLSLLKISAEDAEAFLNKVKLECDSLLQELQEAQDAGVLKLDDGCPVRSIRKVKGGGSDIFIGDIGIGRYGDGEFFATDGVNRSQREARAKEIFDRKFGDPSIIWDFGGISILKLVVFI